MASRIELAGPTWPLITKLAAAVGVNGSAGRSLPRSEIYFLGCLIHQSLSTMIAKNGEDVLDEARADERKKGLHTLANVYEDYVNDVLQFLKTKIRNLEKKKVTVQWPHNLTLAPPDTGILACCRVAVSL